MKIAVIGAGAMGCLYGGILSKHCEVTLFDAAPAVVEAVNTHGILCTEPDGSEHCYHASARLSGDCDGSDYALVILFVKDLYSRAALEANRALIGPETLLLSLQNGMGNEEIMRDFASPDRVLLGTTKHNCVTREAGVIYHSGAGITHVGSPVGNRAAAETVAFLFDGCGLEADVCDSVRHLLWEKLFVNMTINPLTALTDAPIGAIAADPHLRELARSLIEEATAVAAADGEQFDAASVFSALLQTAERLSTGKASMCQDLERKRRTEIDFINGAVVRLGQKYHVPTPRHEVIVSLVHAKEGV